MKRIATVGTAAAVLAAIVGLTLPSDATAQQSRSRRVGGAEAGVSDEPIELSTDVVNVLFSVIDRRNKFVSDVQEGDVVVTENGERQRVFSFRREVNLPLEIVILIDVSSSQEFTFDDEKRVSSAFFQRVLRPKKDSAAVMKFAEDLYHVQGMTDRLGHVADALNRLTWESRPTAGGPRYGATALYDAIATTVTESFRKEQLVGDPSNVTRRALIILSDGADTGSDTTMKEAIDEAVRAGVIVYAIGIGDRYRSTAVKRDVLDLIAQQTGGHAYYPESYEELTAAFGQVEDELRSQYLVAYEPSRVIRDGTFREIDIQVPGRPDVKVFHRKGYFAPKPGDPSVAKPAPSVPRPAVQVKP